jgi:hypothetical protein
MAQDIGLLLRGLGAAVSNQVPQFRQELAQRREDEYQQQQRQQLEQQRARQAQMQDFEMMQQLQSAAFQDAQALSELLKPGVMNIEGALSLLEDRQNLIGQIGINIPNDPTPMLYESLRRAAVGDTNALNTARNMAGALTAQGVSRGILKLPEAKAATPIAAANVMETTQGAMVPMLQPDGTIKTVPVPASLAPKPDTLFQTEQSEARSSIRSNVTDINNKLSTITSSYEKINSLLPEMKAGNRAAINAALMNVARLVSPEAVNESDVRRYSGAENELAVLYNFLDGQGVNMDQMLQIVDPLNPRTFNPDTLMGVARSITGASIPSLMNRMEDQRNIAKEYNLSPQFVSSFLSPNSATMKSVQQIMQSISGQQRGASQNRAQAVTFGSMQEAENAVNIGAVPVGSMVNIVDANGRIIDSFEVIP